ncbi:PEP-CTERM sorting domain-containing protein [Tautonia plasticadhaerens]|uniref:PEP-CTERM sorting domain-containing protein n=1 Tax=Tautonia plasticadhaerens TaxID=2527974 RepID=UPI0011A2FDD7
MVRRGEFPGSGSKPTPTPSGARLTYTSETLAAVPEPSTLAGGILGALLAGGAWLRRRGRHGGHRPTRF